MADLKISQLTGATTPLAGTEVVPLVQSSSTKKIAVSDLTAGRAVSGLSFATANVTVGASAVTAGADISYSVNSGATQKVQAGYTTGSFRPALFMYSVGANHDMVLQFTDLCRFYNAAGATQVSIDHLNSKVTTEYNIIPAAAKGVNFTANTPAAGMTSQLLNWYEEGTWTPVLSSNAGSAGAAAISSAYGIYTRIGNQVTISFSFKVDNVGSWSGAIQVAGIPFNFASGKFVIAATAASDLTYTGQIVWEGAVSAGDKLTLRQMASGGAWSQVNVSGISAGNTVLYGTLTYFV